MEPTKIQVLDVIGYESKERLKVIDGHIDNIREIATKHGIRSLLISPTIDDQDDRPITFA